MHNKKIYRISADDKGYFTIVKLFKSKLLSRKGSKISLYFAQVQSISLYLRPVLAYGCVTCSMTKGDEEKSLIFEKKLLRQIYVPTFENG